MSSQIHVPRATAAEMFHFEMKITNIRKRLQMMKIGKLDNNTTSLLFELDELNAADDAQRNLRKLLIEDIEDFEDFEASFENDPVFGMSPMQMSHFQYERYLKTPGASIHHLGLETNQQLSASSVEETDEKTVEETVEEMMVSMLWQHFITNINKAVHRAYYSKSSKSFDELKYFEYSKYLEVVGSYLENADPEKGELVRKQLDLRVRKMTAP